METTTNIYFRLKTKPLFEYTMQYIPTYEVVFFTSSGLKNVKSVQMHTSPPLLGSPPFDL